jgi:polar amino acid transport system ATP-binding protein
MENITLAPRSLKAEKQDGRAACGRKITDEDRIDRQAYTYQAMLSGRQKQRVAIIRALAMDPERDAFR